MPTLFQTVGITKLGRHPSASVLEAILFYSEATFISEAYRSEQIRERGLKFVEFERLS